MNLLSPTIATLFVVLLGCKTVSSQESGAQVPIGKQAQMGQVNKIMVQQLCRNDTKWRAWIRVRAPHCGRLVGAASECGRPVITTDSTRTSTSGEPHDADHGVWPWMAALHLNAPSQSHFCDGILIGQRHVLTAAHCLHGKLSSEIRVHLGSHFTNVRLPGEQVIEASQICLHKQFRIGQEMYDIGMIKLKEEASFSRTVQPVCLPENDEEIPDNSQLFTTGWGSAPQCSNCSRAKTLKQMTTHSIANNRCLDYFNKTADPSILCSTVQEVPSLFGDTGSPVVGFCAPNYWVVYGIVSDGPHQSDFEHLPLITTKVSRYMEEFIQPYLDATDRAHFRRICGSGR